jgi:hypothetical protein
MGVLTWVAITVLGIIGFAVTGPVAGSLAAIIQSTVYGGAVTAGSWFAVAQGIAMAAPTPWYIYSFYGLLILQNNRHNFESSININELGLKLILLQNILPKYIRSIKNEDNYSINK